MPSASSGAACDGRPPAMRATGGRASRTTASCSSRSSGGTKPRMPTPHGRSPSASAVSASSERISSPRIRDRARKGSAPPSATAAAKALRSLTRVMGPWAIGWAVPRVAAVPAPGARGCSSRATAM